MIATIKGLVWSDSGQKSYFSKRENKDIPTREITLLQDGQAVMTPVQVPVDYNKGVVLKQMTPVELLVDVKAYSNFLKVKAV